MLQDLSDIARATPTTLPKSTLPVLHTTPPPTGQSWGTQRKREKKRGGASSAKYYRVVPAGAGVTQEVPSSVALTTEY